MAPIARTVTTLAVAFLLLATTADAALTTSACLVQKRKAWITFRKCLGTEQVKLLKGKPADFATCDTALQAALAKTRAKATKAAIGCRYRANGDGTVTDYDSGLQWEQKDGDPGGLCAVIFGAVSHCVNYTYTWSSSSGCAFTGCPNGAAFIDLLGRFNNCVNTDGIPVGGFAGHCDWRLPTLAELWSIVDQTVPGCGSVSSPSPCIDPIFGPTFASYYWSTTTLAGVPGFAWAVNFNGGSVLNSGKDSTFFVRAVRDGL